MTNEHGVVDIEGIAIENVVRMREVFSGRYLTGGLRVPRKNLYGPPQ